MGGKCPYAVSVVRNAAKLEFSLSNLDVLFNKNESSQGGFSYYGHKCGAKMFRQVRNNSLFPRPEHEGVQKTKSGQTGLKFPPLFRLSLPDSITAAVSLLSV